VRESCNGRTAGMCGEAMMADVHTKTLIASVGRDETLSRKVSTDAFLFKATKGS
jgi:hypothetical protein